MTDATTAGNGIVKEEERPRVLIVDDQVEILNALQRELRNLAADIDTRNSGKDALEALNREHYALLITDHHMPGMTGIELLGHLDRISPNTSRIVLSGSSNFETTLQECGQGIANYCLEKPWKRAELAQVVVRALEEYRLRVRNQHLAEELKTKDRQLAERGGMVKRVGSHDVVSGLFNNEEFLPALERQIKLFRRDRQPFCVALAAIDGFGPVLDVQDRAAGGAVVTFIARMLLTLLREEVDSSYRRGEKEFAVLMRGTRAEQGELVMNRVLAKIAGAPVPNGTGGTTVTLSIGVGEYLADCTAADFVARVELALASAKRSGKGRVTGASGLAAAAT